MTPMKKQPIPRERRPAVFAVFVAAALLLQVFAFGGYRTYFGVPAGGVEAAERRAQGLGADWLCAADEGGALSVCLFYREDTGDYTVSAYVNRRGLSFGYFFRYGGAVAGAENGVAALRYDDARGALRGTALLSLNRAGVTQIVCKMRTGGDETVGVDPEKPFVFMIPEGCAGYTLYTAAGETVPVRAWSI